jgi:hypothetical protein
VATHLVCGVDACFGPTQDSPHFLPLVADALTRLPPGHTLGVLLADAAYDAEANRAGARALGLPAPVIALNRGRHADRLPRAPERRRAAQRFPRRRYRRRAHAECVFSRIKRTLGTAVHERRPQSQLLALWWRVLAHNIGLLLPHRVCSTEPVPLWSTCSRRATAPIFPACPATSACTRGCSREDAAGTTPASPSGSGGC